MSRILCALCLVVLLPTASQAANTSNIISTDCSGILTTTFDSGTSLACAGSLTLDGGFVTSDSTISIFADGDLSFDNLIFTAPNISFSTLFGSKNIGSGVVVNSSKNALFKVNSNLVVSKPIINTPQKAGILILERGGDLSLGKTNEVVFPRTIDQPTSGGSIVIRSGDLTITGVNSFTAPVVLSAIPEPSAYLMMLLGLGFIAIRRTSNH